MDIHEPVRVYSAANPVEAEIIRNYLESEGIRSFVDGLNQAGEAGLTAFEIGVLVPAGDADRARRLIEAHQKHKAHQKHSDEE